jgi:TRAP-type C4-dicarboxylate transport system permease small subunit
MATDAGRESDFPFFEIPNWAIRLVIMLIVIGFPIALVIAWAFELTPEGLKRTEFAEQLPKKSARSRAWIYVVVVAGAISVGLFFMGRYTATNKQSELTQLPAKYLRLSAVRYIQAVRSCGSDI